VTISAPVPVRSRWLAATIERIERRTPRIVSLFFRVPLGPYVAGQHVDIRLTAPDGYQAQRSYSIASAPGSDLLELAIERLEEGEVSPYFHEVAAVGDTIEMRGPLGGHFVWRPADGGPLLLLGGGSGVVPLVAMARDRGTAAPDVPALLVASARIWDELLYRDELIAAALAQPQLTVTCTTTREPPRRPQDYGRRLDRALLAEILARWGHAPRHVYVCGANAFVDAVADGLIAEGVPIPIIRTERYGGAVT
jgi:ferredoxin-NADP reductase